MEQAGQIKEMEHMLGKRVEVVDARSGHKIGGELQFVGYNKHFPSWGLVCTIDRMPAIHINSVADIKEQEGPFRIAIPNTPQI